MFGTAMGGCGRGKGRRVQAVRHGRAYAASSSEPTFGPAVTLAAEVAGSSGGSGPDDSLIGGHDRWPRTWSEAIGNFRGQVGPGTYLPFLPLPFLPLPFLPLPMLHLLDRG
jgi:hypothetical protein